MRIQKISTEMTISGRTGFKLSENDIQRMLFGRLVENLRNSPALQLTITRQENIRPGEDQIKACLFIDVLVPEEAAKQ